MKPFILSLLFFSYMSTTYAQLEINAGYGINRQMADGIPVSLAYDFKIKNKLYSKSQIGFKFLHHYNDFVEANFDFSIFEIHQTVSYMVINKNAYRFKPNLGINYRWYSQKSEILPPYNTLPQRAIVIHGRNGSKIRLNSFDGDGVMLDRRKSNNLGFTIQLQNQFRLNSNLWLAITPFLEPDYDRSQNTGGCYLGIVFMNL